MIAMLEENPKLKFKRQRNGDIYELGENGFVSTVGRSGLSANMRIDDDWQLIREPVPVWEAIKALTEGKKTVECEYKPAYKAIYSNRMSDLAAIPIDNIKNGTWYIREGE